MKKKLNNQLTLNFSSNISNNDKALVKEEVITSSNIISITEKLIKAEKELTTKLNTIVISRSDHLT